MMHMSFGMHARNKKAQDMYKLLAHHIKHVSVWLLFFHPFSSYLDASKNGQRQPQQSLQQRLVQWKGLHRQWTWPGRFTGAAVTLVNRRKIPQWTMVCTENDCPEGYVTKNTLVFERG
jgi:hypothetical protein